MFASTGAQAGINQVAAGLTVPQPFGSAGDTLNRPAGFAGQVWLETPNFLPNSIEFNLAGEFLPFQFKNIAGGNGAQANLNMIGVYAGLTIWGGPSVLGIRPYISTDIGALYDYLLLSNTTSASTNAAMAFALRAAPGFDLPLMSHLGLQVELPATAAFQKTTLGMWQSTFSLRWKL